jgi:hypothetical protein
VALRGQDLLLWSTTRIERHVVKKTDVHGVISDCDHNLKGRRTHRFYCFKTLRGRCDEAQKG